MILFLVFGPIAGAAGLALAAGRGRLSAGKTDKAVVLLTLAAFVLSLCLPAAAPRASLGGILTGGLTFAADGFRAAYAVITAFMWLMTALFSQEYFAEERNHLLRYWFFFLATLGATEGVMLSADLMTAFVFFEILSFTSFTWVIHEQTPEAVRAGHTYLFIAVIGGLVLFMGLLLLQHGAGTLSFEGLRERTGGKAGDSLPGGEILAAGLCILTGFGAKAGMFPVHIWLPKAHPVAPSPASALLSGILTKVGIYGILMTALTVLPESLPFGTAVLALGAVTMLLGAVLGVFSVSLKRTLACSSMSQIGFILTGTGMTILLRFTGEQEAVSMTLAGVMLHMVNHSLIKLVLFMAAGAAVMRLHTQDLNALRGWGRNKPFLRAAFALGALGISGVPLFSGYISKTLLHEGIVEGIHAITAAGPGFLPAGSAAALHVLEWVFLFSGGLTFAYMLKLYICIFREKNTDAFRQKEYDRNPRCMNAVSTAVICGPALFMVILGQRQAAVRLGEWMTGSDAVLHFRPFTAENLQGGAVSLVIGAAVYLFFVRKVILRDGTYRDLWPAWLDLEELLYRPVLTKMLPAVFGRTAALFGENRILRPLCRLALPAAGIFARLLSDSMDAGIWLLRRTIFREKRSLEPERMRGKRFRAATRTNLSAILDGFTFALMMTCAGIIVILGALLWMTANHSAF